MAKRLGAWRTPEGERKTSAEWRLYRHGSPKREPHKPIFRGQARNHVINKTADVLRDWSLSRFQHEAAAVQGLRSALCIEGYGWQRADRESHEIVAAALRILGYSRPSWNEGQRQFTIASENCNWCGKDVPPDLMVDRPTNYCSEVCARSALQRRQFEDRRRTDEAFNAAWDVIQKSRNPVKSCAQCGDPFRPVTDDPKRRYCSIKCRQAALRTIPDRDCRNCGKRFRPQRVDGIYCSLACSAEGQRAHVEPRPCNYCGDIFRPARADRPGRPPSRYCCMLCKYKGARADRLGILTPYELDRMIGALDVAA